MTYAPTFDAVTVNGPITGAVTATGSTTSRTLATRAGDVVNLRDYGAVGNGTTDDTTAIQAAVTAAANKTLLVPPGNYVISATITGTSGIIVQGEGNGMGPGLNTVQGSRFICAASFTSGDMFSFATEQPVCFRDVQLADQNTPVSHVQVTTRGSGAAIHVVGFGTPGSTNAFSVFERVGFSGFDVGLNLQRCATTRTLSCSFQCWKTAGMDVSTGGIVTESSPGYISNNYFFGDNTVGTAQSAGIRTSCGYGAIIGNLFVGASRAIQVNVNDLVNIGSLMIGWNSIEEQTTYGINIVQTGTSRADAIQIVNNEFSNISNGLMNRHIRITAAVSANLYTISVTGNKFQSFLTGGTGACIEFNAGDNVIAANNQFVGTGYYTIIVGATVTNCSILDNQSTATSTLGSYGGYSFVTTNTLFRDVSTRVITFAQINSHADGSEVYINDGKIDLHGLLVAGGTGCAAYRSGGVWTGFRPAATTGWSTSTNGIRGGINGSTATLAQTSAALAQLLIDLSDRGILAP